jgi:hypothetical protein
MGSDLILIGGAIMPMIVLSADKKDLMRIYRPKIDHERATLIANMISDTFNLQSMFKHSIINLSPYPLSQLLDRPGDLKRIIIGSTITAYVALLVRKGYRAERIRGISSNMKIFDEILSGTPFIAIGYDHEALRRSIELLSEELQFPAPEPRITNLMERLSNEVREFLVSLGVKYVDLAFMFISGVYTQSNNILNWLLSIKEREDELKDKMSALNEAIERSYGLLFSDVVTRLLEPVPPYRDEKDAKEFVEDIMKKVIEILEIAYDNQKRMDRDNHLVYI